MVHTVEESKFAYILSIITYQQTEGPISQLGNPLSLDRSRSAGHQSRKRGREGSCGPNCGMTISDIRYRGVGEVTFEKELSYNYSYFWIRNLGTLITSVTVTTIQT